MTAVNEWIAREYFEQMGFLVLQPVKYQVAARGKTPYEEIDLIVANPAPLTSTPADTVCWTSQDIRAVRHAVVGVRGWHTDRFSPSLIETSPEVFRFTSEEVLRQVRSLTGFEGPVSRILCMPGLPASESLRANAAALLRQKGIDGVISFKQMLLDLAAGIDVQHNYEKSDLLQILRILKNYDLLRDAQLDFFDQRRRRSRSTSRASAPERAE